MSKIEELVRRANEIEAEIPYFKSYLENRLPYASDPNKFVTTETERKLIELRKIKMELQKISNSIEIPEDEGPTFE